MPWFVHMGPVCFILQIPGIQIEISIFLFNSSVHNVRIEHLWVDVTAQVGATWANLFVMLELRHGLDINNSNHIWLLHFIFLPAINAELRFFAESWNEHQIQI